MPREPILTVPPPITFHSEEHRQKYLADRAEARKRQDSVDWMCFIMALVFSFAFPLAVIAFIVFACVAGIFITGQAPF